MLKLTGNLCKTLKASFKNFSGFIDNIPFIQMRLHEKRERMKMNVSDDKLAPVYIIKSQGAL